MKIPSRDYPEDWMRTLLRNVCSTTVLSRQYGGRGLKLTIHLHLVISIRMTELHLYYPHTPSWHGQGNFTFTFTLPEKLNIQKPQSADGDKVQEITTCRKQGHARSLESILSSCENNKKLSFRWAVCSKMRNVIVTLQYHVTSVCI